MERDFRLKPPVLPGSRRTSLCFWAPGGACYRRQLDAACYPPGRVRKIVWEGCVPAKASICAVQAQALDPEYSLASLTFRRLSTDSAWIRA